jgi:1,2-diacylglycerol 3-alpha-glucosyltransferase
MKILILNPILYTADNNIIPKMSSIKDCMIYNLALGFQKLGHEITLVAADDYKPTKTESYAFEILFLSTKYKKALLPSVLPFQPELKTYLKKNHECYDLIISSETFAFNSLFAAINCPQKTLIWQELNAHNNKFFRIPSHIWYQLVVPLFFRKVKVVVSRSSKAKDFIRRYLKQTSGYIIDHGINLKKFQYSRQKKRQFIVVAQLIERKNVSQIIEKFSRLLLDNNYSDFQLLIAGRGYLEAKLKQKVQELGLNRNILFLGFLKHEELNRFISESQASLIDTKQDLNIVSIPESIVSGTPILCNSVPALADFIKNNNLGILKSDWDTEDLKSIIKNNHYYVENCIAFRNKLSTEACAQNLINAFIDENPYLQ